MTYKWTLKDAVFTNDKGKVFSCFSCGGGSTMGYKLAGFDVIGCNEIDPKLMAVYIENHKPKYPFLESITTFKSRENLPKELFNLDILDGSPPCSSFSMVGNRSKDWGKKKKFREGQAHQVLDLLFFDFIDLADRLQPKVVIAENVTGILQGKAKNYVVKINEAFERAGYVIQHFTVNSLTMGVPQERKRVFFIGLRKDLASQFLKYINMFEQVPELSLNFNERPIPFNEIEEINALQGCDSMDNLYPSILEMWHRCQPGEVMTRLNGNKAISHSKINPYKVLRTITANASSGQFHYKIPRRMTKKEIFLASSFPLDYNILNINSQYITGMSVPPLMIAKISKCIHEQWLSKL